MTVFKFEVRDLAEATSQFPKTQSRCDLLASPPDSVALLPFAWYGRRSIFLAQPLTSSSVCNDGRLNTNESLPSIG